MHLTSALKLPTCNFDLLSKVYVSLELFSPLVIWDCGTKPVRED